MTEQFDDDFSQTSVSQQGETPPLDRIILAAIDSVLRDTHVAMPAKVIAVRSNGFVDIQPLLQRKFKDGTLGDLPPIQDVPVKNLSGQDWWIKCPVAVGDVGTALFHERSLDNWKVSGGTVDPGDFRRHDLSDAEFVPGLRAKNAIIPGDAGDMVLHNGSGEIYVLKAGKFKLTNGSQELFDLMDQFIGLAKTLQGITSSLVSDLTTIPAGLTTAPGNPIAPSPPLVTALGVLTGQLTTLQGQLTALQTNLDTLKGT